MKALLVNGSPRANGNTMRALEEVASALRADIPVREPWQMTNFIR